jgi:hypothetical protein
MDTNMLTERFVRTEAGKAEISHRSHSLSRPARNLLLMIDSSVSGQAWLDRVSGSGLDDLRELIDADLVECVVPSGQPPTCLDAALEGWTHDALYTLLTREAKERFGLLKGYRLILKIEGCADLAGLRRVAHEFVNRIAKEHGEESAARFRRQLTLQPVGGRVEQRPEARL